MVIASGVFTLFLVAAPATLHAAALTDGPRLAAIYDAILDARFVDAEARLDPCAPAPESACLALKAVSLWWQILLNPESRLLDARFEAAATAAIRSADAWTRRESGRAEAWFYYAGARAPLVQWRVLRGERLAAAREGARIKEALERALALDPSLMDAYFGIGLYHYYADVAPAAARMLRWLLLLPGGDREQGLEEMLKARGGGELLQGEADYQLHFIYLWYENDPHRALELITGLDARYPGNPVFLERIAAIQADYLKDQRAVLRTWETLLSRVRDGISNARPLAETRARLGIAMASLALDDVDRAIEEASHVVERAPLQPLGAAAEAHLLLGDAYRRAGRRDLAVASYNAAIDAAPGDDRTRIRGRAREALRRKF
jgi:tetratricopeptide (TPR) repeat protein